MKKKMILLLVALFAISLLASCGSKGSIADIIGPKASETTASTSATAESTKPTETEAVETTAETTEAVAETTTENTKEADPTEKATGSGEYSRGVLTATEYFSEFLNLRFKTPKNYTLATEREMDEMMNIVGDVLGVDKEIFDYAKLTTVYEMMAIASNGMSNVNVISEKLPFSNMTVETYLDIVVTQFESIGEDIVFDGDIGEVEMAGGTFATVKIINNMMSVEQIQLVAVRKQGDRMLCITFTTAAGYENSIDTMMAAFSEYFTVA